MHSPAPTLVAPAKQHASKPRYALASYHNPQPNDFDFHDVKAVNLCNALACLFSQIGAEDQPSSESATYHTATSPVVVWVQIHILAKAIEAKLYGPAPGSLRTEGPASPLYAIRRFLLAGQKDWGVRLFAQQDPDALAKAMKIFLQQTLARCESAFYAAEKMCRYPPHNGAPSQDAEISYAGLCKKSEPWSILDFNFLPLRDLCQLDAAAGDQPLTFEATGFVPTQNGMGYMTSCLDPYSNAFTWHTQDFPHLTKPALEIGAAFGVATIAALRAGARVVANDLSSDHLAILERLTPEHLRGNLTTNPARFPENLDFASESFSSILVSRVLHFLKIPQLEQACALLARWIEPGGHLFIVEDSPYLGNTTAFVKTYEARKAAGETYPGMHENVAGTFTSRSDKLPDLFHFFDTDVLARIFQSVGLEVLNCQFFPRLDYPADVQRDGREGVGLIARKPRGVCAK